MEGAKVEVPSYSVTYNEILAKREAQLSKDALAERQATQLTKYFIRARRRQQKETIEQQAEFSRRHYERNLQKAKDAGEAAAAMAQMVQEEKIIISAHMAEKGRERQAEELRAKEEQAERMKWQQARVLYERFQADERARLKQELESKKLEKLKESSKKHQEYYETKQKEKETELQDSQKKREAETLKVLEKKNRLAKECHKESRQVDKTVKRKMQAAETRRQALQQKVQETAREHLEAVPEKVELAEKKRQKERQDKLDKILEKAEKLEQRLASRALDAEEDMESSEGEASSPRRPGERSKVSTRGLSKEMKTAEDAKAQLEKKEETAQEKHEEPTSEVSPRICYDSKDLIAANSRIHRDYVHRLANLQQAGEDMLTKKQFKALESGASGNDGYSDAYSFRIRSLHQHYIKEGKGKISSPKRSARTPRRRVPTCGLCERPFPLESLVGNASQKMLRKLKEAENQGPDLLDRPRGGHKDLPRSNSQVSGAVASPTSPTLTERPAESLAAQDKVLPGVRLYDAELPLCAACYHRVRICSSH